MGTRMRIWNRVLCSGKQKVWRKRGRTRLTHFVSVLMVQVVGVFVREAIEIVGCYHSFNLEEIYKPSTV